MSEDSSLTPTQIERIRRFGIPVDFARPEKGDWVISLDTTSLYPNTSELKRLRNFKVYLIKETAFSSEFTRKILRCKLTVCEGYNTVVLKKTDKGWFYRRKNWEPAAGYLPNTNDSNFSAHSLVELIGNHVFKGTASWSMWKTAYPKIFPAD